MRLSQRSQLRKPFRRFAKGGPGVLGVDGTAQGTFVAINNRISQSVSHLHVHVVPRRKKDGLKGFFWPRNPYRGEEHRKEVQGIPKEAVDRLRPHYS